MIDRIFLRTVFQDSNTHFHVNYEVFITFRGEDVRDNFLSNLTEALRGEGIDVFTDDMIQKGEEIAPSLFQAIETSLISLVILSQNYSNSSWCLDELVKILQCKDKDDQAVIPVFLKVMPTDVRYQTGKGAEAFSEHEKEYGVNSERVIGWRSALQRTANISGFCSSMFKNEAELIKEIVKCVLSKLDDIYKKKRQSKRIGLGNQISHVEALLIADSKDVRAISIWGMAGSGKTTIAERVYNMIHSQFDACYFKPRIREEWMRHGRKNLKKELYSNLLRLPNLHIVDTRSGLPDDAERMLRGMKVLVVLDDVNDLQQLNYLIGSTLDWFGKGSRIIITTRDKQVIPPKWVDDYDVYEVKPLDFDDSYRLFNLHAFDQNHPKMDNDELFKKMVNDFAQGNPLVLKELGHFFSGKDTRTCKSQFEKLAREPSLLKNVHDAIKVSYNDLNSVEQKVFLDIAFLSDGLHLKVDNIRLVMNVDNIQLLLKDGGGYNLVDVLHSLKNKALLTVSQHNVVSMHSIIQVTAHEIVREESRGKQLFEPNDKRMKYICGEKYGWYYIHCPELIGRSLKLIFCWSIKFCSACMAML